MRNTFRPQIPRGGQLTVVLLLGIALMLLAPSAGAESRSIVGLNATITGRVTDSTSSAPVVGASVLVEGTGLGAVTDSVGHYRIANVPTSVRAPVGTFAMR